MDAAELFWALHADLPREGVGSDATTRILLDLAGPLPPARRAMDIGCGPGRAALVLAAAGLQVTAVDRHLPFLRRARGAAVERGLADRVSVECADMAHLPHADATFDLLWCEGAAYVMGVDTALAAWRRLLRSGGVLVLTEVGWTVREPSAQARAFWAAAYPQMRDARATVAAARAAGYDVVATHDLPESDWWEEYYVPLGRRIARRRATGPDAATEAALRGHAAEIDLRRSSGGDYGYTGYVLRRR